MGLQGIENDWATELKVRLLQKNKRIFHPLKDWSWISTRSGISERHRFHHYFSSQNLGFGAYALLSIVSLFLPKAVCSMRHVSLFNYWGSFMWPPWMFALINSISESLSWIQNKTTWAACNRDHHAYPNYSLRTSILKRKMESNNGSSNNYRSSVSSVAQSCPTLCDPMDCSTPGLPVHHQLPELTQTHVHW